MDKNTHTINNAFLLYGFVHHKRVELFGISYLNDLWTRSTRRTVTHVSLRTATAAHRSPPDPVLIVVLCVVILRPMGVDSAKVDRILHKIAKVKPNFS